MTRAAPALVAALLAAACTTTTTSVQPVPAAGYPIRSVCIERNPEVVVEDLLAVIEGGFARHGIEARVLDPPLPLECEYTVWYTARRRWDIRPVLGYAEVRVRFHGETIGAATYLSRPSLSLFKWRSTESKLGPLIDLLLDQYGD